MKTKTHEDLQRELYELRLEIEDVALHRDQTIRRLWELHRELLELKGREDDLISDLADDLLDDGISSTERRHPAA